MPGANLEGRVFGDLTALRDDGVIRAHRAWLCRCACGKMTRVSSSSLTSGNTRSCGCGVVRAAAECRPSAERFETFVDRRPTGCWLWKGEVSKFGYGRFRVAAGLYRRRKVQAHRFAYEQAFGPIPAGMSVCHRCDNRKCVRPDHLFVGTALDNTTDMVRKGRHRYVNNAIKLSRSQVDRIRRRLARKETQRSIAATFGVHASTISNIATGKTWAGG